MQEKCTFPEELKIEDLFIYLGHHILMYIYM